MTGSLERLGHRDLCSIQWSDYCDCETGVPPVLVTSEALMFAERAGIPWPDERPYEEALSDGDGDLG